jgi:mRNA interferase RelE/StbE
VNVDAAVEIIVRSLEAGEHKRGVPAGAYVYKVKSQNQLMLLAYEYDPHTRML